MVWKVSDGSVPLARDLKEGGLGVLVHAPPPQKKLYRLFL